MIKTAKKLRQIVNQWVKTPIENFEAFKEKETIDILDMLFPKNFDTPEKAVNTCYKMWAKKLAFTELEEQKQIADKYDLENK